ncbi:hypothetical protein AALA13_16405 [Lachnospiraceae bacterium 50-23]
MFEKFGEFDSYEEINRAAAAQLKEGDEEAVYLIAKENGLDEEDAEDFCTGAIDTLTTAELAAVGKLNLEAKELELKGLLEDWKGFIAQSCMESRELSRAVRKKGKRLETCMGNILKASFEKKERVNDGVVKAAGLKPPVYIGIPGRAEVRKIVEAYYLEGKR